MPEWGGVRESGMVSESSVHADRRNENGECLINLCPRNNLVVTITQFKHLPCHQMIWYHPAEREQRRYTAIRHQAGILTVESMIRERKLQ